MDVSLSERLFALGQQRAADIDAAFEGLQDGDALVDALVSRLRAVPRQKRRTPRVGPFRVEIPIAKPVTIRDASEPPALWRRPVYVSSIAGCGSMVVARSYPAEDDLETYYDVRCNSMVCW